MASKANACPTCAGTGGCKSCGGLAQWEAPGGKKMVCSGCIGTGRCGTCNGRRTV